MATPKISTQASTPTFPTGAAQCDRLLRVNDIRAITGWSENTARKFMCESGKLIQSSNYMFESSFYELFKQLEGRTAHLD
jgi:hypothetical protein